MDNLLWLILGLVLGAVWRLWQWLPHIRAWWQARHAPSLPVSEPVAPNVVTGTGFRPSTPEEVQSAEALKQKFANRYAG